MTSQNIAARTYEDPNKRPKFDKEVTYKVPKGYMVIGVRIPVKSDIVSEKGSPIDGLMIMKQPNRTILSDADIYGF